MPHSILSIKSLLILLAILSAVVPAAAEEYLGGKIVVTEIQGAMSLSVPQTTHGYSELRFRIQNKDTVSHHVRIAVPAIKPGSSGRATLTHLAGEITVAPSDSGTLSLFQPVVRLGYGHTAAVTIDGNRQNNVCQMSGYIMSHAQYTSRQTIAGHILMSEKIDPKYQSWVEHGYTFSEDSSSPTGSGTGNTGNTATSGAPAAMPVTVAGSQAADPVGMWRSSLPFGEWSDNWLSYTRFDGVMVTDTELNRGTPAVLRALRQYVEAGGVLIVCAASTSMGNSEWNIPKDWTALDPPRNRHGVHSPVLPHTVLFGDVFFLHIDVPVNNSAGATPRDIPQIEWIRETVGQKALQWGSALNNGGYRNRGGSSIFGSNYGGGGAPGILCGSDSLLTSLPVIDDFSIPVRLIMALIIVFAVLIGPVNIYILSLWNKRIWLIWTVPAISIVASGIVLSVSWFQEGILCNDSSSTVTVLNQQRGEAFTYGFVGYYSTLTPRGGLKFDTTSEITATFDRDNSTRSLEIMNVPGKQLFTRGWISPRLPSYFAVRKSQSRNERLEFQWGDQPTVVNGLGVSLAGLWVCSPDGKQYQAMDIPAGGKATLAPFSVDEIFSDVNEDIRTRISTVPFWDMTRANYNVIDRWVSLNSSLSSLPPGTYATIVTGDERNPFMETALEKAVPYQHQAMIIGIF